MKVILLAKLPIYSVRRYYNLLITKRKKLITKMSAESAVIVAISPLAVIDMFFIAWRNIRLINKIAAIYGIAWLILPVFVCLEWYW